MPLAIRAACIFAAALLSQPCGAADLIGTAGPIRMSGATACHLGFDAMMDGACDPPPVDTALAPKQRSRAHVERARQLIGLFRNEQANRDLDAAIADNPRNVSALVLRGRMKIPGQLNAALEDLNTALRIDPNDSDALATRAFVSQDAPPNALHDVNTAIARNPNNIDALWIRAMILAQLGTIDGAERDLTSALAREPDDFRTRLLRAELRMKAGKIKEAEDDATIIIASRADPSALQIRAVARGKAGNYAGALDDLNAALGEPGSARPPPGKAFVALLVQRALALARTGKAADARRDIETIAGLGGAGAILQMQIYLRSHGFPDIQIDGKRSDLLDDALLACFINDACGRGLSIRS